MKKVYGNLSKILFEKIPELEKIYIDNKASYEEFLKSPHIIYGDLLNPYMLEKLEENVDKQKIKDIFTLLEELASNEDKKVQEVIQLTVLERLGDDRDLLEKGYQYMGPKTRALSDEIEKFWQRKQ